MQRRVFLLLCAAFVVCASRGSGEAAELRAKPYLDAARSFADAVIDHGRDTYGAQKTPLFVDGLQVETLEPARWLNGGETWILSNLASQQPLMRLLDGLTGLTGDKKYRRAAEETTGYALEHVRAANGLLYWGGHLAWDLDRERPVGQGTTTHELKTHQPYYELMWRVNPEATRKLMETIWAGHVLDWSLLDYNRHASTGKKVAPPWDHGFRDDVHVPFPTEGGNLSFCNVTPPLMRTGVLLSILGDDSQALTWTRRLVYRWQQGRDPKTGLCGGQLSYRRQDRAQEALGHVHPNINEAKIVATYHQLSRYHHLPLAQMQAAEALIAAGGEREKLGREFIRWASEDLRAYTRASYDPERGQFIAVMTDGTPLRWQESKTGYYAPTSFAPLDPDGSILWGYAMAYRLTRDDAHWKTACELAGRLGLGQLGRPEGTGRQLRQDAGARDWRLIYAILELHRATGDRAMLLLACRVADNLLKTQTRTGIFPRPGRDYARTGDEVPLAFLHLAAALEGKESSVPQAVLDSRFFHCEYHGKLRPDQQKRADSRTMDDLVFYGPS